MKRIIFVLILMSVFGTVGYNLSAAPQTGQGLDPVGLWLGTISFGSMDLRIAIKIVKTPDGSLKATMDSLDQGAKDIPVDSVTVEGNRLLIEMKAIKGSYDGTFNPATQEIEGTWKQIVSSPLKLKRVDKLPDLAKPQEPRKPFPYLEEDVTYENKKAGIKLAGTLTKPQGGGPFPAVLLITGSGAQDRNEMIMGHKPFMVIADYLTRQGLAVLRVDDRGVGGTTGDLSSSTSEDLAGDVLAGIAYLKSRPDINGRWIGLIGHSEGGLIAPMVAAQSPEVAFIVLLAGTGVTGERILYEQGELISRAEGAPEEEIAKTLDIQKRSFAVLKENKDPKVIEEKLKPIIAEGYRALPEEQKAAYGTEEQWAKGQIQALTSPWFRFFLTYDPKPTLSKVACPVLAMGGSKDLQVPAGENLKAIGEALQAGGNKNYKTSELPGLNHLFQTAQTGGVSEYGKSEETFSPLALKTIGDWVLSVVGPQK
jgi:pimeloyl-ACP methyl ester carboxylesterase